MIEINIYRKLIYIINIYRKKMFRNIRLYAPQKKLIKNLVIKSGEYDMCFGNSEKKIIHKLLIADHHFYTCDIHCWEQLGDHSLKEIYTWTQTPSFKEAKILRFTKETTIQNLRYVLYYST